MKYVLPLVFLSCISCQNNENMLATRIANDKYHGQSIEDPYRNAENLEDPQVATWVDQQNKASKKYLSKINKTQYLIERLHEHDKSNFFTISKLKVAKNSKHFYLKRIAGENIGKLFYRDSFSGNEILLYDPKSFKKDSPIDYIINYIQPDSKGSKIVVSITEKGKEISELIIIDVATKEVSPEILTNSWVSEIGGVTWLPDDSGFIYLYHPEIDPKSQQFLKNTKSVIHTLGNSTSDLVEFFSKEYNKNLTIDEADFPLVSLKDDYFIGEKSGVGAYNDTYYLPVEQMKTNAWKPLFKKSHQIKDFIIKEDTIFYRTSKNSPNFEIRKTSIRKPNFDNADVVVKEKKDTIITDFEITNESLYFATSKNGIKADLFKIKNDKKERILFPYVMGNMELSSKGIEHPELWIITRGWITPTKRYEYQEGALTEKSLNPSFDDTQLKDIVIDEVEVEGHDGEKIPLSLIYNKTVLKNNDTPTMIDGYGAYGVSMIPFFSMRRLLWVLEGGVYAIAHVRGGGEKGDAWHKAGFKTTKPNTWKDFISCAEYLIEHKFTSNDKLAIWSGSAGGIMIGRAITDRPDLFKSAVIEFGALNTLRLESTPNGANNAKEFGTIEDSLEFEALKEMDAYHHIKQGEKYPATLLTAGLNDPRVPAWFSVKFAARMQAANASDNPNLLLIDSETGHGTDDTKLKEFERYANILAFAFWQTGHPDYQPKE